MENPMEVEVPQHLDESSKKKLDKKMKKKTALKKSLDKGKRKLNEQPVKYMIRLHKDGEDVTTEKRDNVPKEVVEGIADGDQNPPPVATIRKYISGRQLLRRFQEGVFSKLEDVRAHLPNILDANSKYLIELPEDDDFHISDYPGECDKLLAGAIPSTWIFNDYGDRFPMLYETVISAAEEALEPYNSKHNYKFEVANIEKVNMKASRYFTYSITFTANDAEAGEQTFRAKVEHYRDDDTPWNVLSCKLGFEDHGAVFSHWSWAIYE